MLAFLEETLLDGFQVLLVLGFNVVEALLQIPVLNEETVVGVVVV